MFFFIIGFLSKIPFKEIQTFFFFFTIAVFDIKWQKG
jgi:hypothetical protein